MTNFDDENLITLGEALEQLDEDNLPRKKFVTPEDQYALDSQGRRRFHGAFTGGFSAGYFNSVNTRDGWTPHQFRSSRNNKAKTVCQRPEDFMDDEDTSEFGIAPISIRASSDFVNHTEKGTKRKRIPTDNNGPIPGTPVLRELLKTVTDTIGVTLLKKMGWKPGQGVGPRLTKNKKKMALQKNVYNKVSDCYLSGEGIEAPDDHSESGVEDHDMDKEILLAPDDFELFQCNSKDNYFGIGYSRLNRLCVSSGHKNLIDTPVFQVHDHNKKLSIRGQAFGVGAFETDDIDIYEPDDMTCYDFALGPESKKNKRWSSKHNECQSLQRRCLKGFILAENRLEKKIRWGLPKVSKNVKTHYVMKHTRFSVAINKMEIKNKSKWKTQEECNLDARDRGKILDEFNYSDNINSYIEGLQKCEHLVKHNQHVQELSKCSETSRPSHFVDEQESLEEGPLSDPQKLISMPSWMNKLATKSFVSSSIKSSSGDNLQGSGYHGMKESTFLLHETCDIKIDERNSFESRRGLIKSSIHDIDKPVASSQCEDSNVKGESTTQKSFVNDFVIKAAQTKMFGKCTRILEIWHPVSAVCKGFNISQFKSGAPGLRSDIGISDSISEKEVGTVSVRNDHDKSGILCDFKLSSFGNGIKLFNPSSIDMIINQSSDEPQNFQNSFNKIFDKRIAGSFEVKLTSQQYCDRDFRSNKEIIEACNWKKANGETSACASLVIQGDVKDAGAKYDLFQAIFLSSSESSESDRDLPEDMNSDTCKSQLIRKSSNILYTEKNTSPAQGIFTHLNLDDMLVQGESTHMDDEKWLRSENSDKIKLRHSSKSSFEEIASDSRVFANSVSNIACNKSVVEIGSDTYGPTLPVNIVNVNNQSSSARSPLGKLPSGIATVPKLNNLEKTGIWVEKAKMKKSKKMKKKRKRKERTKGRKYQHKSKKN